MQVEVKEGSDEDEEGGAGAADAAGRNAPTVVSPRVMDGWITLVG